MSKNQTQPFDEEQAGISPQGDDGSGQGWVVYPLQDIRAGTAITADKVEARFGQFKGIPPMALYSVPQAVRRKATTNISAGQMIREEQLKKSFR